MSTSAGDVASSSAGLQPMIDFELLERELLSVSDKEEATDWNYHTKSEPLDFDFNQDLPELLGDSSQSSSSPHHEFSKSPSPNIHSMPSQSPPPLRAGIPSSNLPMANPPLASSTEGVPAGKVAIARMPNVTAAKLPIPPLPKSQPQPVSPESENTKSSTAARKKRALDDLDDKQRDRCVCHVLQNP